MNAAESCTFIFLNGKWVNGYAEEEHQDSQKIKGEWHEEISKKEHGVRIAKR